MDEFCSGCVHSYLRLSLLHLLFLLQDQVSQANQPIINQHKRSYDTGKTRARERNVWVVEDRNQIRGWIDNDKVNSPLWPFMLCCFWQLTIWITNRWFAFSRMFGLFQTVFYFGYMGLFSLALGLMTGTIGYGQLEIIGFTWKLNKFSWNREIRPQNLLDSQNRLVPCKLWWRRRSL